MKNFNKTNSQFVFSALICCLINIPLAHLALAESVGYYCSDQSDLTSCSYVVNFESGRSFDGTDTTFTYQVCEVNTPTGEGLGFSHISFEIPMCDSALNVISCTRCDDTDSDGNGDSCQTQVIGSDGDGSICELGLDPTTQIDGVKFNDDLADDQCKVYSFKVSGNVGTQLNDLSIKAGDCDNRREDRDQCEIHQISGPSCGPGPDCEDEERDECGVCFGDGSSCADCNGEPNGGAVFDECGVCGGDGSSCADCFGVPNGGAVKDQCGVCGGDNSSCADCNGVPNGGAVVDECGVCGGDGSTCADCNGIPNGGAVVDECGVCGGDNTSCVSVDCNGERGGSAVVDACGVCGGDNSSCADCNGVPNGDAKLDQCGVCGGSDNCVDCKGVVNGSAKVDRCGICGGDGSSCLGCAENDISAALVALDGNASRQRSIVQQLSGELIHQSPKDKKISSFVNGIRSEANNLYLKIWTTVWSLPKSVNKCTNILFCTQIDNGGFIESYNSNSQTFRDLVGKVVSKLNKNVRNKRSVKRLLKLSEKLHQDNLKTTGSAIPRTISSCS